MMYNCINFPEVYARLSNCFDFLKNNHFYPTRQATKGAIKLPFARTEHYIQCIAFSGAKIWNSIPDEIRNVSNLCTFKNRMSKYIFLIYLIQNCKSIIYLY